MKDDTPGLPHFSAWLDPEDRVCVWDAGQRDALLAAWSAEYRGELMRPVLFVSEKVFNALRGRAAKTDSLYQVARSEGLISAEYRQSANSGVKLLQRLLSKLRVSQTALYRQTGQQNVLLPDGLSRAERNRRFLAACSYHYIFTPDSKLFHARGCPCMLNAKRIDGSLFYDFAAHDRSPCRLCRPVRLIQPEEAEKAAPRNRRPSADDSGFVRVRLVSGDIAEMRRKNVIGYCHCALHEGALNKRLLDEHECLKKGCRYLQKYEERPFWIERENRRAEKAEAKEEKRKARELQRLREANLAEVKRTLEQLAAQEHLSIIGVEQPTQDRYTVYYVSDNPFADWYRFPEFLQAARDRYSEKQIILWHIKAPDGSFVTREQFRARRR